MAKAKVCGACGLKHSALGCNIVEGTLYRRARSSRHLLRLAGGAWAFVAALWDAHPEVRFVEIEDTDTGQVFYSSREVVTRRSFRRDLGAGLQLIIPLSAFEIAEQGGAA